MGRRLEVTEAKRLFGTAPVVTLTGVGGVGKTRLAIHVAAEVQRAFRDGVWVVELATLEDSKLLAQTVLSALHVQNRSSRPPVEVLVEHVRDMQMLVVLDNCEHLLEECAVLAATLVRSAPEVRILATSREALGIAGERVLAVPTLSLPLFNDPQPPARTQGEAVQLFAERAAAALPGFEVTENNRETVERICRQLDGLPLAIELAAVRLRMLSPEQLLARLENRFQLLTTGPRATLPRQRTLRALVDWSYGLCTEPERLLWARASVFAGGLDLEAAEAVCSGDGIAREQVLDLVAGLVDKSVLVREESPAGMRYRMLETIRQYGREQLLASGQEAKLRRRHRDHYRDLAARARAESFGPYQVEWFARLRIEHANLRQALEFCFAAPEEAETGLGMATDLVQHWKTGDYLSEGRDRLDQGLSAVTEPSELRGRAMVVNAWLANTQADLVTAESMVRQARAIGEQLGLEAVLANAALYAGTITMYRGDGGSAVAQYEEAVARHRTTGDPMGLTRALVRLCLARALLGDTSRAVDAGEECLAICEAHGDRWVRAYAMTVLGVPLWLRGDAQRATALERESLRFQHSIDDVLGSRFNIEVLAWIAAGQGQHRRAATLLGIVRSLERTVHIVPFRYRQFLRLHDECESCAREALGKQAFEAAVSRGAGLSYDEKISFALGETDLANEPPGEKTSWSPLTRRETEIARLVAQGMSNKEIAAALVIGQRTAEGHVEHILSKLGFNSRTQIAVWARERDTPARNERPTGQH
ncbi:ATP-binding protein [Nonomuraea deserti]|uniref:ATP-binding protein n=1 Tax=Nonomuraea deserti TaxID=1848322 RepID=UPI001FEB3E6E|nr:LuxR C-terminal-related transcriptional regulator [Nonomuraea deserti]